MHLFFCFRLDEGISALISSGSTQLVLELLEELFDDGRGGVHDIRQVIYAETSISNTESQHMSKWPQIAEFCEDNEVADIALEIKSAQIVKDVIHKALSVIALDEKDQFDYYR